MCNRWRSSREQLNVTVACLRRQTVKVKVTLGIVTAILIFIALNMFVRNRYHFFVMSEAVHAAGIMALIYKLTQQNTCSGLSLKSQELTVIYLAARMYCSLVIEYDIHTFIDSASIISTTWVIYMMRFKLNASYMKELDNMPRYYTIAPCFVLAILFHPHVPKVILGRILWAFCVYLESVSVLPQLRLMQKAKIVEPLTAHYVFALGVARFLAFAHWIIRVIDTQGAILLAKGVIWFHVIIITELIQTFILADFCYYYVKSRMSGQLLVKLPV